MGIYNMHMCLTVFPAINNHYLQDYLPIFAAQIAFYSINDQEGALPANQGKM